MNNTISSTMQAGPAMTPSAQEFEHIRDVLAQNFAALVDTDTPLFVTDAEDLFEDYLRSLPSDEKQVHQCNACSEFMRRYGNLVTVNEYGDRVPVMWVANLHNRGFAFYGETINRLHRKVARAKIVSEFFTEERRLGTPVTGVWTHYGVPLVDGMYQRSYVPKTSTSKAEALRSVSVENYGMVCRALVEFNEETINKALRLLHSGRLVEPQKVQPAVEWLHQVQARVEVAQRHNKGRDLLWREVAMAPIGFIHLRGSVVGSLLRDIAAGASDASIIAAHAGNMRSDQYKRPQSLPDGGNVAQAEALIETLGLGSALLRRLANLDEVPTLWLPAAKEVEAKREGVFGSVKLKGEGEAPQGRELPAPPVRATEMSFAKFKRTVMNKALRMFVWVKPIKGPYTMLTTAVEAGANPLIKWDSVDQRNPVAWYTYTSGSAPQQWGLAPHAWSEVVGITNSPWMWNNNAATRRDEKEASLFVLQGACDRDYAKAGIALFPDFIRSDLHAVRKTIEAFSQAGELQRLGEQQLAAGHLFSDGSNYALTLAVETDAGFNVYEIDRWE